MKLTGQVLRGPLDLAIHAMVSPFVKRHHILLACMPKSGSTYLSNVIGRLPEFRKTSLVTHYGRSEQELDSRRALRKGRHNYVCQHHVQYNSKTEEIINCFNIKPVILVRNIFDCVPSLRDHLRKESVENSLGFFCRYHAQMDDRTLERMIVELVIPWYIQFYVSWTNCKDAMWITYDQATTNPEETIREILDHIGIEPDSSAIRQVLSNSEATADRKNVGLTGRGEGLRDEDKETIRSYCTFYPHVDFSLIGIP